MRGAEGVEDVIAQRTAFLSVFFRLSLASGTAAEPLVVVLIETAALGPLAAGLWATMFPDSIEVERTSNPAKTSSEERIEWNVEGRDRRRRIPLGVRPDKTWLRNEGSLNPS